jgi:CBS domain-containing protein
MATAKEIMTTELITVSPEAEIREAAKLLLEKRFNGVPVVDGEGKFRGVICQSDLIATQRSLAIPSMFRSITGDMASETVDRLVREMKRMRAIKVRDAMSTGVTTVGPNTTVEEIARIMVEKKLYTLPVVEDGKLVGIVGKEDVLKNLLLEGRMP